MTDGPPGRLDDPGWIPLGDRKHGTVSGRQGGCKCARCRLAWSTYMVWWRTTRQGRVHKACPTCSCPMPERPE